MKMIITIEGLDNKKDYDEFYYQMCIRMEEFGAIFDNEILEE